MYPFSNKQVKQKLKSILFDDKTSPSTIQWLAGYIKRYSDIDLSDKEIASLLTKRLVDLAGDSQSAWSLFQLIVEYAPRQDFDSYVHTNLDQIGSYALTSKSSSPLSDYACLSASILLDKETALNAFAVTLSNRLDCPFSGTVCLLKSWLGRQKRDELGSIEQVQNRFEIAYFVFEGFLEAEV